ncbi:hypothetical protein MTO96_019495 [Rhipicephalus appendiculatus]
MDMNATVHAPWSSVPAAQPALGLLFGVVNMLTHMPFTDLPVLGDYELGELRPYYDYTPASRCSYWKPGGLEEASRQIPAAAPFNIRGRDDWDYWSVPQKHAAFSFRNQRLAHSRGKVLGGSSVLNFMMYTRGNPGDYDRWAKEYGAEGWSYEDVLPHFKEIEDYRAGPLDECHGTGGEIPVDYANTTTTLTHLLMEACQQAGYAHVDFNGPTQSGCSRLQSNVANGKRFSASKAFIQPIIRERKNLHVALLSQVTKVNFDGKRAVGVTFTRLGRPAKVNARREVILSAGTVGSAQLLLLSGVGPREDLERLQIPVVADLPVGRNLQDHPALIVGVPVSTDVEVGIPPFSLADIQQYASNGTGTIAIPVGNEFVQFLPTEYAEDANVPDVEVATVATSAASQLSKALAVELGMLPEAFDDLIGPLDGRHGFRAIMILNRPRSRGSISLRSKNPYEHPEHRSKHVRAPIRCEGACSSAPMGSHPQAVLDERLRVRGGVTGLRVADASVMPDVITGHTNAPSMMIGSKAAAMIIEDNAAGLQ